MAVENNADAVRTLRENNEGIYIYEDCIKQFLLDYDTLKCALGRIDHVSLKPYLPSQLPTLH